MSRLGVTGSVVLACGILVGAASGVTAAAKLADGDVVSISCAAPGECAAGGSYAQGTHTQAFVVSETNGSWRNAIEVPGMAALNARSAAVYSISCGTPGNCAAGGSYAAPFHPRGYVCHGCVHYTAFVVTETHGTWGHAIAVPGLARLNTGGAAAVDSISCGAAGECVAGGSYLNDSMQAFVVSETHGKWGKAIEVPGITKLHGGSYGANVNSVSCVAPGDCAAGGIYGHSGHRHNAFLVTETNGIWSDAMKVPGPLLDASYFSGANSVSCGAVGDCAAGGFYTSDHADRGNQRAFVVTETNGSWGDAIKVPGTAKLNDTESDADSVDSISCAAPGYCAAEGVAIDDRSGEEYGFLVNETNGSWGNALRVPGFVDSISCGAAGDCAAGGYGFVVSETNGRWGNLVKLPLGVSAISCAGVGDCAAGGYDRVVSETNGLWGKPIRIYVRVTSG